MSVPKFPTDTDNLTRDNVINQILSSIAMEELGLSHIINVEGEKMQYILGTLEGVKPPDVPPTIEQVLDANASIQKLLDTIMKQQMFLKSKMSTILCAAENTPPMPTVTIGENGNWFVNDEDTGQTAIGTITISGANTWVVNGVDTGISAQGAKGNTGAAGADAVVTIGENGNWYVNGVDTGQTAVPTLDTILSISDTNTWELDGVDTGVPVTAEITIVGGNWYVNGVDTGVAAQGPQGEQGPDGPQGEQGPPGATGATGASPTLAIVDGEWEIDGVSTGQEAQGPAGASAIIPYASGVPVDINMLASGLAGTPAFVGFGIAAEGATALGTTLDFTGGTLTNFAFTMPKDGTVTDISATILVVAEVSVSMNPTVYLYTAPAGTSTFNQIPTATLTLPDASLVVVGDVVQGTLSNLDINLNTGDQLLLVVAGTSPTALSAGTLLGYISAGVAIATYDSVD